MQKALLLPLTTILIGVFIENCARAANVSDWDGLKSNDETLVLTGNINVPNSSATTDVFQKSITQTIDGNGFAIDGTDGGLAPNIKALTGAELTLKNLTVQNFSQSRLLTTSGSSTGNITVQNSTFQDNTSTTNAPAIYFDGKGKLTLINTNFDNNYGGNSGGAVLLGGGTLDITGGTFSNNQSKSSGGAIYLSGGDLNARATVTMRNVIFDSNTSKSSGGAISAWTNNNIELDNVTFTNNSNMGNLGGGAINISNSNTLTIKNSNFTDNFSTNSWGTDGGAIQTGSNVVLNIDNTKFSGNHAEYGGAIAMSSNTALTVTNSEFRNNYATGRGGDSGAIVVNGTLDVFNTIFDGNYIDNTSSKAGAMWIGSTSSYSNILSAAFNGNSANYGGALYLEGAQNNTIVDTDFTGNTADEGGAIYAQVTSWNLFADKKDVLFSGNSANNDNFTDLNKSYNGGGAIYFDGARGTENVLNLNASEGRKMIFDDTIASYAPEGYTTIIDINKSGLTYTNHDGTTVDMGNTGEIQFNNFVGDGSRNTFTINLYGGMLSIGQNAEINKKFLNADGYIDFDNLYIRGDSVLNTVNNKIGAFVPYEFVIDSGVNWQYRFDVDLANGQSDILVGAKNDGVLNISLADLNILGDATDDEITVSYSETNVGGVLTGTELTTSSAIYSVQADNDDNGSRLVFTKTGDGASNAGLAVAIKNKSDVFAITDGTDEVVDKWFTNKVENNLTINANGHGITAGADDLFGLVVASNNALTINNATDISGFNNALVTEHDATLTINDSNLTGNNGDAVITNHGTVNINAINSDVLIAQGDAALAISVAPDTQVNIGGNRTVVIDGEITGGSGRVNIATDTKITGLVEFVTVSQSAGTVSIANIRNAGYELTGGTLDLTSGKYDATSTLLGGGHINMANGATDNLALGDVKLTGRTDLSVDANLTTEVMDTISAGALDYQGGAINVHNINLMGQTNKTSLTMAFADDALKEHVTTDLTSVMGEIYRYSVAYDADTGDFTFASAGNDYQDFNPAVMSGAIAAQLGGYLTLLNSYDEAFHNVDMYPYMLISREQRQSIKRRNKYDAAYLNLTYDESAAYRDNGVRIRPYASFEKIRLNNGPRVKHTAYGSHAGFESRLGYLGNGWDGLFASYAGYNASTQKYSGINIDQKGGTAGIVGMAYKGNFFTGLTLNAGANAVSVDSMYGDDDFSMFMAGVASKTGYNLETADGMFIVQPNLLMSYSFVNTFDYTNAADVKIKSDPLQAVQIEPGIRLMGSFSNGWLPYAFGSMVWSIMDKTDFSANDIALPELSVKPFAKYGLGVHKNWGNRLTSFLQCDLTSGGRDGIGLQAGFRWIIGK